MGGAAGPSAHSPCPCLTVATRQAAAWSRKRGASKRGIQSRCGTLEQEVSQGGGGGLGSGTLLQIIFMISFERV